MNEQFEVPILFIVFKRPETTKKVFEKIKDLRPKKLYVAANAARKENKDEIIQCSKTREIVENISWDCDVYRLYRDEYLSVKESISSAVNWFFKNEEEGIILEDDCVPDLSFFKYCAELLGKYRYDERIMVISGTNLCPNLVPIDYSYSFTKYTEVWGWASWKRAWKYYDINMKFWTEAKNNNYLDNIFNNSFEKKYWKRIFKNAYYNKIDTWDYQWFFANLIQRGLTIIPQYNLINNIGFNCSATHTTEGSRFGIPEVRTLEFPLKHPLYFTIDYNREKFYSDNVYLKRRNILKKILDKIQKYLS